MSARAVGRFLGYTCSLALLCGCNAKNAPSKVMPPRKAARSKGEPSRAPGSAPADSNPKLPGAAKANAAAEQRVASAERALLGHRFLLSSTEPHCSVQVQPDDGGSEKTLSLELAPPCYFVDWVLAPPDPSSAGPSRAQPIGSTGDVRAYQYPSGISVFVIIGGPMFSEDEARARNHRCAGGSQAVLLGEHGVHLSPRINRAPSALYCVEGGGPDEKSYWLFAHAEETDRSSSDEAEPENR